MLCVTCDVDVRLQSYVLLYFGLRVLQLPLKDSKPLRTQLLPPLFLTLPLLLPMKLVLTFQKVSGLLRVTCDA